LYYAIIASDREDSLAARLEARPAHLARLQALQAEGRLIYRINEGPRVRVRQIRFAGNRSFSDWRLRAKVQTKTALWIFRVGAFDADGQRIEVRFDPLDLEHVEIHHSGQPAGAARLVDAVVNGRTYR
jgi:hypothetical protein